MKIALIILLIIVILHKPTYCFRWLEDEHATVGARIPLWLAIFGLIDCEPETFVIVTRKDYDKMWDMVEAQHQN